ncbi:MAG: peptide ABC transporter substrate-binding protein [Chloroflexi bacterium]|nr:peptide ABC transporter substrate-binding protein [Chloroflexota bacterium]MDA1239792.1 peptide ABC transporter substrate-binding protein [Chloroflexota bacterium]MQC47655.1 peptide ABC transporter substrate-binding protein [Chloroflexota bacterium]
MSQNRLLAILLSVLAGLVLVVGGLSAVLLLSGGGGDTTGPDGITTTGSGGNPTQPASGRLRLSGTDPVTLDPHTAGDASSAEYIVEIFSGLVTLTPDLDIVPDLAESFDVSPDGLTYTFVLRENATFHTGRRVTADDIKWSIERAASRELASPTALAYLGDIIGVREHFHGIADGVPGVEVVDERTVRITIDAPKPYFLAKLTYPTAFVVDRQQVESNPRNWTRRPNGTGAFKLAEWRLGERIVLQANAQYVLGAPKLSEVVYLLSGGSALTRFENDELDVAFVSVNDIDRARDPSSTLGPLYTAWPQFTISYIAFNTNVPPFDDVHVRRALGLAIDRARISEITFSNMLTPATGILMPGMPGYQSEDLTLPFDPEAAVAELALSRYVDDMPPIIISEVGAGAEARTDTQAFLEQWRTILGINVEVQQTDFATFLADQDAGRLQAFNAGWIMDYPDPEDILDLKFHSASTLNDVSYSNPEVDALLDRARIERDPAARLSTYQEAERLIVDEAAWLPLYFSLSHVVVQPQVTGWFEPPMVVPRLRFIEVSR